MKFSKKVVAWLLCLAMVLTTINLPAVATEVKAAEGSDGTLLPSVTAFASVNDLKDASKFALYKADDTGKAVAQKVNFGNDLTWYIAGADKDGTLVLIGDPKKPLVYDGAFNSDDEHNQKYTTSMGTYVNYTMPADAEVYPNHYGASEIRAYLIGLCKPDKVDVFSSAEQALMKDTTVYTKDTKNGNSIYATSDKLYVAHGDLVNYKYITVGANSASDLHSGIVVGITPVNSPVGSPYADYNTTCFWLRTACDDFEADALYVAPCYTVNSNGVWNDARLVVPAFHMNLQKVLFASAATVASSEATISDAMTFRMNGEEVIKSKAKIYYDVVQVTKGEAAKEYLYIQYKDGEGDKLIAEEITEDKSFSSTKYGLYSYDNCKIWIEKYDEASNLTYAVMAEDANVVIDNNILYEIVHNDVTNQDEATLLRFVRKYYQDATEVEAIVPEYVRKDGVKYTVTKIADKAFNTLKKITNIYIPDTVTEMVTENGDFHNCPILKTVRLSNNMNKLPANSFGFCKALTTINIPNTWDEIPAELFFLTPALKEITIPNSVKKIGKDAFLNSGVDGLQIRFGGSDEEWAALISDANCAEGNDTLKAGTVVFADLSLEVERISKADLLIVPEKVEVGSVLQVNEDVIETDADFVDGYLNGYVTWVYTSATDEVSNYRYNQDCEKFTVTAEMARGSVHCEVYNLAESKVWVSPEVIFGGFEVLTGGDIIGEEKIDIIKITGDSQDYTFSLNCKDQYGEDFPVTDVVYSVETNPAQGDKVSMNAATGVLTVSKNADACTATVKATIGSFEVTKEVSIFTVQTITSLKIVGLELPKFGEEIDQEFTIETVPANAVEIKKVYWGSSGGEGHYLMPHSEYPYFDITLVAKEGFEFSKEKDYYNGKIESPASLDWRQTGLYGTNFYISSEILDAYKPGLNIYFDEEPMYTFTGSQIKPAFRVFYGNEVLKEGKDYTIKYKNNINAYAGTDVKKMPTVTVTGKGRFSGSTSENFVIMPQDLSSLFNPGYVNVVAGDKVKPALVTEDGYVLKANDFTSEYANKKYTESGFYEIKPGKSGNFTGEYFLNVNVVPKDQAKKFKGVTKPDTHYEGYLYTCEVTDAKSKNYLEINNDYVASFGRTGNGVVIVGRGDYVGMVYVPYVCKTPVSDYGLEGDMDSDILNIRGFEDTLEYNSDGVEQTVLLEFYHRRNDIHHELTEGVDYKLVYKNNKKVGTATVTINFIGQFKGTPAKKLEYTITPKQLSMENTKVTIGDMVYNGKAGTYYSKPIVTVDGVNLKPADYDVIYALDSDMEQQITKKKNLVSLAAEDTNKSVYVKIVPKEKGNYTGALCGSYNVYKSEGKIDLSKAKVSFVDKNDKPIKSIEYTGDAEWTEYVKPVVTIGKDPTPLRLGIDYNCVFTNYKDKGKASVVISGMGDYVGSKTVTLTVKAKSFNGLANIWYSIFSFLI